MYQYSCNTAYYIRYMRSPQIHPFSLKSFLPHMKWIYNSKEDFQRKSEIISVTNSAYFISHEMFHKTAKVGKSGNLSLRSESMSSIVSVYVIHPVFATRGQHRRCAPRKPDVGVVRSLDPHVTPGSGGSVPHGGVSEPNWWRHLTFWRFETLVFYFFTYTS